MPIPQIFPHKLEGPWANTRSESPYHEILHLLSFLTFKSAAIMAEIPVVEKERYICFYSPAGPSEYRTIDNPNLHDKNGPP